jgi:hypothetical protein
MGIMLHPSSPLGGTPTGASDAELSMPGPDVEREDAEPSPSEAFGILANEVRIAVIRELFEAERNGDDSRSFSELQSAANADSSAGFAYHLRQLDGTFVTQTDDGYVLTGAGRAAAEFVTDGAFSRPVDHGQAS